ncbi:alpha-2-macroglobulin [Spirosoma sp. BT702]|uniref:Alpha-2-macroglobulin n=1 Tax=Spirosoma profusum TaxID=2771354 RepID=A0A926Y423_9BACT|nr:alpha-2-macroglobulin family protein [Spirosoma profusum]MBD2702531.1 alpha-2-macroglobulin [Spirosoma profusum]
MQPHLTIFFILLAMAASGQNRTPPDYNRDWKRADSLAGKGLPKSALEIAERIYKEAKAQKNYPQATKAAMRRLTYRQYSDENGFKELVRSLQTDIAEIPEPAKSILQSVLGDTYWQYFQQNRYKFYNRTTVNTSDKSSDDFTTWDPQQMVGAITKAYLGSIRSKELLQKTPISTYEALIEKGDADVRPLRPTLYDLLAHRAIDFFQNTEPDLLKPVFRFELDQADYFAAPATFVKLPIQSRDSLSGRYQALELYQELLTLHLSDANPDALADVDALRLAFVHQYSVLPERDSLYQKILEQQIVQHKNKPTEAVYAYQLAEFLSNYGGPVRPLDADEGQVSETANSKRWNHKKAADLCRDLISRFPKTLAGKHAGQLLNRLLRPNYSVQVERVNVPQQPFRALFNYQNINKITYRIIQTSIKDIQSNTDFLDDNRRKKVFSTWLKRPNVAEKTVTLPDDGDLNLHSVEIPLAGLPIGHYLLLITSEATFSEKSESVQFADFTVSSLGYISQTNRYQNEGLQVFVTNRQTGEPVKNVQISIEGETTLAFLKGRQVFSTDVDGRAKIPPADVKQYNGGSFLLMTSGSDTLASERQYNYGYSRDQQEPENKLHARLFTDRAIYRPGQPIYVKGLVYSGKANQFAVTPNQDVTVELLDQNGESVAKQDLKTNEFGTFSGNFTAPVGRVTGTMTLQTPYGSASINVEEYKRPTFEVKTKPIKQAFKLGQTVTLSAEAKTFSGAVVDKAEVRYRVVRKLRPRWSWWYTPRNSNQTEITNGTAQTDEKGNVKLTFVATPDREQSRESNPVFEFDVTIDVTDQAGETRSTTQTLRIGYTALQADLTIPDQVEIGDAKPFSLRVTNQSGEKVSAKGQLMISQLQPPARVLRARLWNRPDRQLLSREEFEKQFPNDLFANENDPRSWPKGNVVQQQAINAADSLIKPDMSRYVPGEYVAELTLTDSTGETTKDKTYFSVVDDKQPTASVRPDGWLQVRKATAEPGEEAVFWVGNNQPAWVLMTVEEDRKLVREEWLKTDGKPRRVTLPVSEKQRGGFAVHFAMVQNGRLYQKSQTITVPFTNKQLTIDTKTFRSKLKPGDREEWTLTVKGLDKTSAELVTTMYDASLDAFTELNWPTSFYTTYSPFFYGWRSGGFGIQSGNSLFYRYQPEPSVPVRQYDQLAVNANGSGIRIRGRGAPRAVTGGVAKKGRGNYAADGDMAPGMAMAAAPEAQLRVAYTSEPYNNSSTKPEPAINPRRNFNETAFFFPQLQTDTQGNVVLKFTMPEALTRWRLLTFAHTKDLKTGTLEREIITQKELMITANAPRFLREGDTIRVTARVNNLSEKTLPVTASLTLLDALTGEPISQKLGLSVLQTNVTVAAGQGQAVGWTLIVPAGLDAVTCRLTAQSGNFTDGEEFSVPVLPNRMLVTDSQPFWVNGKEKKEFRLKPLTNLSPELPAKHERLTVEVTSNPAWYALQSLPYLMEYRYECAEQLFSRLYANSLAAHIVGRKPAFREVIATWQKTPPKSPLEANQELKAVTLENSPWLADARSETERTAKLGQLLDANRMESEQFQAFEKLKQLQTESGGFRWFGGMQPNLSITLHILSGLGHLQKLKVDFPDALESKVEEMRVKGVLYADNEMKQWVEEQKRLDQQKKTKAIGSWYFSAAQFLYARSFYLDTFIDKNMLAYLKQRIADEWTKQSLQGQALSAMALYRFGDVKTAEGILRSLRERARESEELGMYWPDNTSGLYWYQTPIETQSYIIEAFEEIRPDHKATDDMKRWLLRQKQTQSWSSTKATTEAIYAILLRGSDWLNTGVTTQVSLGGQSIESRVTKSDAVTGYQKVTYAAAEIKPEMGVIQLSKTNDGPAWGALYWQHFEPLDRVMPGSAGLSVQKTLYVQKDSPKGPVITSVTPKTSLKPGDLIKVRLVLKTDRVMEYVHLKDSRASGFEPVAVLSGYKFQNGLGYYESPRDASTDFFMSYLPVGTHVFEYELRVAQTGDFSTGVATVQCFYAPEFAAHSAGERVRVSAK